MSKSRQPNNVNRSPVIRVRSKTVFNYSLLLPLCFYAVLVGHASWLNLNASSEYSSSSWMLSSSCVRLAVNLKPQEEKKNQPLLGLLPQSKPKPTPKPDGYFQGHPVYYKSHPPQNSHIHCVGDNFNNDDAWIRKSCSFQHLCFDLEQQDYVVFQSPLQKQIADNLMDQHGQVQQEFAKATFKTVGDLSTLFMRSNSDMNPVSNSMALGALNKKWGQKPHEGVPRLKWFPRVIESSNITAQYQQGYYELPEDVLLIPYHAYNGANPGHLVWDDFLPIYHLARIFSSSWHQEEDMKLLPLQQVLDGEPLWATCQWDHEACLFMYQKFGPLLVGHNDNLNRHHNSGGNDTDIVPIVGTNRGVSLVLENTNNEPKRKSNLVCAKRAAAGTGYLTDHGLRGHGWEPEDYQVVHNLGKGPILYDFRNYMMRNIGLDPEPEIERPIGSSQKLETTPARILFSTGSSARKVILSEHIQATKQAFPNAIVQEVKLSTLTVEEQVRLASETNVFVSGTGGGAVTAIFLPKGASSILFYREDDGRVRGQATGNPARLDWDMFNNLSYIRVHWLPAAKVLKQTIPMFLDLIRQELETQGKTGRAKSKA